MKLSLLETYPKIANQWHPTRNGSLTPAEIFCRSDKKVWWKCPKGPDHEWLTSVRARTVGKECPACSGRKVVKSNCLATLRPDLAKQWHPTKNGALTPNDVVPGSGKIVFWICKKKHIWKRDVYSRNKGTNCPYCYGRYATKEKNLALVDPKLAQEWHPTKNGALMPVDVMPNSGKKVWWICRNKHEWQAAVYARRNGNGCRLCSPQSSAVELRVFTELKAIFRNVEHRVRIQKSEIDILIRNYKLAIEIDGSYWHKKKGRLDNKKTKFLESYGYKVFRLRGIGLKLLTDNDISFDENGTFQLESFKRLLEKIRSEVQLVNREKARIAHYLEGIEQFKNEKEFSSLFAMLPGPLPGQSFLEKFPLLAKKWHPTMNFLKPSQVFPNTRNIFFWLCSKGHHWEATVADIARGHGCPFCSNKRVYEGNCLANINPSLAAQWHPTKNGTLRPTDVIKSSHLKVWWACAKGHEWEAPINNRAQGRGCPQCTNRFLSPENNLATAFPKLASEWHPTKNGTLSPEKVVAGGKRKYFWLCKNMHYWEARIDHRINGSGCPVCRNQKAIKENCLKTVYPKIAAQWHPTKNKLLTPKDVVPGSGKIVWWVCSRGHDWKCRVLERARGRSCPRCAK